MENEQLGLGIAMVICFILVPLLSEIVTIFKNK